MTGVQTCALPICATGHRLRLVSSREWTHVAARVGTFRLALDSRESDGGVCGECCDVVAGRGVALAGDAQTVVAAMQRSGIEGL